MIGLFAVIWALGGIGALLGSAIFRLSAMGIGAFAFPLQWYHWLLLLIWVPLMAHSEGYRGFQRGFSPRVAARIAYLRQHPSLLRVLLAPFFAMGYFQIKRRRQLVIFALTTMIVTLIITVRQLPQPWRGLVDVGVVVGLIWGLVTTLAFTGQALAGRLDASPELPES